MEMARKIDITRKDEYLKTEEGYLVAWPLATPPHEFGDWSAVEVKIITKQGGRKQWRVNFVRTLSATEVAQLTVNKLWWGMKVPDSPWALVAIQVSAGASSYQGDSGHSSDKNPFGRVGV